MYLVEIIVSTGDNWAQLLNTVHTKSIYPSPLEIPRLSSESLALQKTAKYEAFQN